jgi:hypothetical protein
LSHADVGGFAKIPAEELSAGVMPSDIGMPLAWGAKAHAGTGYWDLCFCRTLKARGQRCALTGLLCAAARRLLAAGQVAEPLRVGTAGE